MSVVVPCFNEESVIPYLGNTLDQVSTKLKARYSPTFILVDDCSTDNTPMALDLAFGGRPEYRVIRHQINRGVSAAILTGIRAASTEIVCSIDCDCTYDPHELEQMIPLLSDGVDLVTASPYHPSGMVHNVPRWRLTLSKCASALYRVVLIQKLHTYTACFRVYRRSVVLALDLREPGFLGLVELVGKLDLAGKRVEEYPAALEARVLGRSKMRVIRTVWAHLGLLARLAFTRARSRDRTAGKVRGTATEPAR